MSEHYDRGVALLKEMMGAEFADGMEKGAQSGAFGADVPTLAIEFAFGSVWNRSGLSKRDRSVVVISSLITSKQPEELKNHIKIGLDNGLTTLELQEI